MPAPLVETAERVAAAGISILPTGQDKRPTVVGLKDDGEPKHYSWDQHKTTRPSKAQVRAFMSLEGTVGYGVIGGRLSGNLETIDFDDYTGKTYADWLALIEEYGLSEVFAKCYVQQTQNQGTHVVYRCEGEVEGTQHLCYRNGTRKDGTWGLKCMIETKGQDGYACMFPTPGYKRIQGSLLDLPVLTVEQRATFLALARSLCEKPVEEKQAWTPKPRREGDALRPGDDFNARADWEHDLLGPDGCSIGKRQGSGRTNVTRPGKKLSEGPSGSIGNGPSDLLWNFSSNWLPLDIDTSYSKFSYFTLTRHGSLSKEAFAAATADLRKQGYGDQTPFRPDAQHKNGTQPERSQSVEAPTEDQEPRARPEPRPSPEMFYGLAGEYVRAIDPYTEADPVAVLAHILFFVGSAMGRSRYFLVGPTRHHGNLFLLVVGKSGRSRKGTSFDWVRAIADRVAPWWAESVSGGLSTPSGLVFDSQDTEENRDDEKIKPFVETEFTSVLKNASRDGNPLSEALRQLWEKGNMNVKTRKEPLKATNVHFSLAGHVTEAGLMAHWSDEDSMNGLGNRFLWLRAKRSKLLPRSKNPPPDTFAQLDDRMMAVVAFARQQGVMDFDAEAEELWVANYEELTNDVPGEVGALMERAEAQIPRLAMIYAVLDVSPVIRLEHLVSAYALWQYCLDSIAYLFRHKVSKCGRALEELLSKQERVTRSELQDATQRNYTQEQLDSARDELVGLGLCSVERGDSTGGRKPEVYVRTPLYEETKERRKSVDELEGGGV